jgi:ubiquinone/menaquinone biosynthesis C-methylase UbiE
MEEQEIKNVVRKRYGKIAKQGSLCCGGFASSNENEDIQETLSKKIGYTDEELKQVPDSADLGLGCGNPVALASLKEGEAVLDLGSGAGIDCFLAAQKVGKNGKVIGIDMTIEMIEKARENARKGNYSNVQFRLGEIENLPVVDNSMDVVISNCVINLVPNKRKAFMEAFRVLKPGGRLMISDIVLLKELPDFIKNSIEAYASCISGAIMRDEYISALKTAGFKDIRIINETFFPVENITNDTTSKAIIDTLNISNEKIEEIANSVVSIEVFGSKPNYTA